MNTVEIDKLFSLIITDNFQELYPLVKNIESISHDDSSIYKVIADYFFKNCQIDAIFLKFTDLIKKKSQEGIKGFYNYEISNFYVNIISQYDSSSIVLKLIQLLSQNNFPNIFQVYNKVKMSDFKVPTRLIYSLGKLLILLNLNLKPIPLEYVMITHDYLKNLYRAIIKDYYSEDFPSFIINITNYFHLFSILLELIFDRVTWWDKAHAGKYGGEIEDYHESDIDFVLKHEIKLQIHDGNLTINYEDLYLGEHAEEIDKIVEFNELSLNFNLQYDKIIKDGEFEEKWLIEHLESILSENDFKKWRKTLSNWKSIERKRREIKQPDLDKKIIIFRNQKTYQYEVNAIEDFESFSIKDLQPVSFIKINWFDPALEWYDCKGRYTILSVKPNGFYVDNENNRITEISFQNAGLTRIPDSIGVLKELRILNLMGNNIKNLPGPIQELKNLEILILDGNQITNLQDSIGNLSSLKYLELSGNRLKYLPQTLSKLQKLEYLGLSYNNFRKLPECVCNLNNLYGLDLDNNKLMDLPERIDTLEKLDFLSLRANRLISLPESFNSLTSMKILFIDHNKFCQIPKEIYRLTDLRRLSIAGRYKPFKGIRGYIDEIKNLNHLIKLEELNLSQNRVEEIKGLNNLKLLKSLDLSRNRIKNISNLDSQKKLQVLLLNDNQIKTIENIDNLTELGFLELSYNQIETLSGLGNLKKLTSLYLNGNKINHIIYGLGGFKISGDVANPEKCVEYCQKQEKDI